MKGMSQLYLVFQSQLVRGSVLNLVVDKLNSSAFDKRQAGS